MPHAFGHYLTNGSVLQDFKNISDLQKRKARAYDPLYDEFGDQGAFNILEAAKDPGYYEFGDQPDYSYRPVPSGPALTDLYNSLDFQTDPEFFDRPPATHLPASGSGFVSVPRPSHLGGPAFTGSGVEPPPAPQAAAQAAAQTAIQAQIAEAVAPFGGQTGATGETPTQFNEFNTGVYDEMLGRLPYRRSIAEEMYRMRAQDPRLSDPRFARPWQSYGQDIAAQFMLDQPAMLGVSGLEPTARQYLQDYPGGFAPYMSGNPEELLQKARLASLAGITDPDEYLAAARQPGAFAGDTPGATTLAHYASLFGPSAQNQAENQLAIAQLIALQRQGGGMQYGNMADATRAEVARQQQAWAMQDRPIGSWLANVLGQQA